MSTDSSSLRTRPKKLNSYTSYPPQHAGHGDQQSEQQQISDEKMQFEAYSSKSNRPMLILIALMVSLVLGVIFLTGGGGGGGGGGGR